MTNDLMKFFLIKLITCSLLYEFLFNAFPMHAAVKVPDKYNLCTQLLRGWTQHVRPVHWLLGQTAIIVNIDKEIKKVGPFTRLPHALYRHLLTYHVYGWVQTGC